MWSSEKSTDKFRQEKEKYVTPLRRGSLRWFLMPRPCGIGIYTDLGVHLWRSCAQALPVAKGDE
jgi:hypothetical protein